MKNSLYSNLIILVTTTLLSLFCFGQEKEVFGASFSISESSNTKGGYEHRMIGSDGEFVYTRGTKAFVNKWDQQMNQVTVGRVPMKTDDYSLKFQDLENMHFVGDKFLHLFGSNTHSKKQREIYVVEYDKNTFEVKNKNKIASLTHGRGVKPKLLFFESKGNSSQFGVATLVSNGGNVDVRFFLLNSDLSVEMEGGFTLYREWILSVRISNFSIQGDDISFLVSQGLSDVERMVFHVLSVSDGSHAQVSLRIHNLENEISDFVANKTEDGKLYVSGFYEAYESTNTVGGVFTQSYNLEDGTLLNQSLKPFDFNFITSSFTQAAKKKAERKNSKGKPFDPFSYYVREVFVNPDGSSLMVGECYNERTVESINSNGQSRSRTYYTNGDIILVRKNSRGEIEWVKKYPRMFISVRPDRGGIVLRDRNEDSFDILYPMDNGGLAMAKVNKSMGTSQIETVYSQVEIGKDALIMSGPLILGDDEIILQISRWNLIQIIKVDFEK